MVSNSFAIVFVPKCKIFSIAVEFLATPYQYSQKSFTAKEKSCAALEHCALVLNSFAMVFVPKYTIFPKLYKFCHPHINIFTKPVQPKKKLRSFGILALVLNSFAMAFVPKCTIFSKSVQIPSSPYQYF